MNLLNYRKALKSKVYIFIVITLIFNSCIDEKDYRKKENLDLLMSKTIKYADDFNEKDGKPSSSLLGLNFKINKTKINKKKSEIHYIISIPHNLRDEDLRLFLEEFSDKFRKKYKTISIDIKHVGIGNISGIIAKYNATLRKNSIKLDIDFVNYISKENLKKKGIRHYILEYDYAVLVYISKEMSSNKNLSLKSASIRVANNKKMSMSEINDILKFAKVYYQKI